MGRVNIYTLNHPLTNEPRYVGKTIKSLKHRLNHHLNESNYEIYTHKVNWIRSLKNKGLLPTITLIDSVKESEWQFWEKYWISQFKTWGFSLTNHTEGGDGINCLNKEFKHWATGKKLSKESLKKRTETRLKNNNGIYQNKFNKIKIKIKKYRVPIYCPVYMYDLEGNFIKEFFNRIEVCKELGISKSNLVNSITRKHQTGGYLFSNTPIVFDKYDTYPNKSKSRIFVFDKDKKLLSIEDGMVRLCENYNININGVNSATRRLSLYKGTFYFVKEKDLYKFELCFVRI